MYGFSQCVVECCGGQICEYLIHNYLGSWFFFGFFGFGFFGQVCSFLECLGFPQERVIFKLTIYCIISSSL